MELITARDTGWVNGQNGPRTFKGPNLVGKKWGKPKRMGGPATPTVVYQKNKMNSERKGFLLREGRWMAEKRRKI